jgi:hypothetical protein
MDQDSHLATSGQADRGNTFDGAAAFAVRRRVIKGLVGLPAVVTLASGAPASAISVLNCALNSPPTDGGTDYVAYDPNEPNQRELTQFGSNYFDDGTDTAVRLKTGYSVSSGSNNLVYVDPDGGSVSDAVPVVASCYASFANTA